MVYKSVLLAGLRPPASVLRVTCNAVTTNLAFAGSPTTDRFIIGDGTSLDLCETLRACIAAHSEVGVVTVTVNSNGQVVITTAVASSILWANAATTLDEAIFGFTNVDSSSSTTHTAPNQPDGTWRPNRALADDTLSRPLVVGGLSTSISGLTRINRVAVAKRTRMATVPLVQEALVIAASAASTHARATYEYLWTTHLTAGRSMRLYTGVSTFGTWFLRDLEVPWERNGPSNNVFWDVKLNLREA